MGWAAIVAGALSLAGPAVAGRPLYTEAKAPLAAPQGVAGLPDLTHLAEAAIPAVVGVITTQAPAPGADDDQLRELFERLHDGPRRGIGSG
ncbi:MAG TPA: 2-alkenal reductase, partial [Anaeromyxobacter sp.]